MSVHSDFVDGLRKIVPTIVVDPNVVCNLEKYLLGSWTFEEVGSIFFKETGFVRPGTDDSRGIHSRSDRHAAWLKWLVSPVKGKIQ